MMETRLTQVKGAPAPSFTPERGGVLQRNCACDGLLGLAREESSDKQLYLQRSPRNSELKNRDSRGLLRSPGQPLDERTSAFIEPRFGHDFGRLNMLPATPESLQAREDTSVGFSVEAERVARQDEQLPPEGEEELTTDPDTAAEVGSGSTSLNVESPTAFEPVRPMVRGGVQTILRPGQSPYTSILTSQPAGVGEDTAKSTVAPGGTPTVTATGNDCLPSTSSAVLAWDVVSADAANWGVSVTSLTLAGQLNIQPWPSNPTSMVVPNTANPVDGGNINNTAGSSNHWQAAIDDMANYDTAGAGGGAGPNWHSTAASSAHEWEHWNTEYVSDSVGSAAGGNWTQTNTDLDALREPRATSATAAAARTALEPRVNTRKATWRSNTISRWNTLISTTDQPGSGGRGYAAGARVLSGLIASVRAYKTSKGW